MSSTLPSKQPKPSTPPTKPQQTQSPRVAFISGHLDLSPAAFTAHYKPALDAAIARGDNFIVASSRGADSMALEYLLAAGVEGGRVVVYLNAPAASSGRGGAGGRGGGRGGGATGVAGRSGKGDVDEGILRRFRDMGVGVEVVKGGHGERDAVMTANSDYDVLWVRGEEETRRLYGKKYRPGRVSGTEKNRVRRETGGESRGGSGGGGGKAAV